MSTDVKLDVDGVFVVVEAAALKVQAPDLILDLPARRKGAAPHRRALVHDFGDGLTVNFNGDYPGGVTINGSVINLNTLMPDQPAAGDVRFTFFHPDEVDEDGNPRVPGFNETVFLGVLLSTMRDEIAALKDRVAKLESK